MSQTIDKRVAGSVVLSVEHTAIPNKSDSLTITFTNGSYLEIFAVGCNDSTAALDVVLNEGNTDAGHYGVG